MEQRREPRFAAEQIISITVMGERDIRYSARVTNASGRGLGIELPVFVAPGTAVKIDLPDALILGEAVFCQPSASVYVAGVELQEALHGLAELARRVSPFRDESVRAP